MELDSTKLSKAEKLVFDLIPLGLNRTEMAERLCLSVGTIRFHLTSIYRKLNVKNKCQLLYLIHKQSGGLVAGFKGEDK